MSNLEQKILSVIQEKPGIKAKQIADIIEIDRKQINSLLYGRLRGKVKQDKSYRWYLKDTEGVDERKPKRPERLDTPLSRLCAYYLDCLNQDDLGGVSVFAESKYGEPDYAELQSLPMIEGCDVDLFESEAGKRILTRMRRDRNRQSIFIGYPIRLKKIRSRKGWEGFILEPILLISFQDPSDRYSPPILSEELPHLNFRALKSLSNAGDATIMEEAIQLADELGLGNASGDQPDLDELMARLYDVRYDWDWKENPDPDSLTNGAAISGIGEQGIYNRAVLVAAERSPYTKGLETELGMLQTIPEAKYGDTVIGAWLRDGNPNSHSLEKPTPLIEVLPLNTEQRQAVRQSLSQPLTVITGPPGTGKSQVVTSILVNAAWQNRKVLFVSKNNKAVDVVEVRVNSLGPRPVLLRLGANQYQNKLAAYLTTLLAASADKDEQSRYNDCKQIHSKICEKSSELDNRLNSLIALRNEVDQLEQAVEHIRQKVGPDCFSIIQNINEEQLNQSAETFLCHLAACDKSQQSLMKKLIWPIIRKRRFKEFSSARDTFSEFATRINLPFKGSDPDKNTIGYWIEYGKELKNRLDDVRPIRSYFESLQKLNHSESIEKISQLQIQLTDELSSNSKDLWNAWLRLQPSRMTPEQRKLLGDYSAILQMIISANENNQNLRRDVFRRYYQLFPQITSILSCWAVTSLSARGRVPFESGFFDLVVIDEASQCDIASVLPLLYRAKNAVVIGDPMQLRHISTLTRQQDQQLLSRHNLIDEYPGWAYSHRSLFDLASSLCRSEDIIALRDHHRSHADIIEFSNDEFYEGRLRVATKYDRLKRPYTDGPAVRWINVEGAVKRPANGGAVNDREAFAVISEIERLASQGYQGSIGVVSPFRAQANRIRDLVHNHRSLTSQLSNFDFLADTVHKFQGDERDVMIFSPVVSSGISRGAIGFLRGNPNLFNVAITRARAALIVVGDQSASLKCEVDYLSSFAAYSDRLRSNTHQDVPVEAIDYGPEYPPVDNPELVSEWEHLFYRALYQASIRPIPQYPIEKYILDFAVVDGKRKLNIEVDGERYHRNWDGELCRRDQIRNQRMMELGWDVKRFWVYQIRDDLGRCVRQVKDWLNTN